MLPAKVSLIHPLRERKEKKDECLEMPYIKTSSIGTTAKSKMITAGNIHIHPYVKVPLLDLTLSKARQFYSSMQNPSGLS